MSGGGATVGSGRRWGRAEAGSTRSVRAWQQRVGFDAAIVFEEKKGQKSRSSTEQSVAITTMVSEAKLSMKMCCLLQLIFSRSDIAVARLISCSGGDWWESGSEAGERGSTAHAGPEGGRERSGGARRFNGKGSQQERRKVGSELVWAAGGRAGERWRCAGPAGGSDAWRLAGED
uniref:Uncharacterized protein n=1 Tax=Oryza barthii TaxID=65489 RepID=A0A0D3HLE1_9ORYZ